MAGSKYPQAVGPTYRLNDLTAACQDAINCYPKKIDEGKWILESAPGEETIATVTGAGRGFRDVGGRFFGVYGNTLYEINGAVMTSRGTLSSSFGDVGMAHNNTQLAIVDGPNLYIFTLGSNAFTLIISPGWRGSKSVAFMDGYFIFVALNTEQFYLSAIDDGTALDALDFSSADTQPDNILTHKVSHRQAWFFGRDSTEIWVNSGGAAFPFTRYDSYSMDVGCVGVNAAINAADTLLWVGRTARGENTVYIANGNQPSRVSTVPIEQMLKSCTNSEEISMWCYQVEGSEFVGIDGPGIPTTLVYDVANQMWHERAEWDNGWFPRRSRLITAFANNHYAADSAGNLIRLNSALNQLSGRHLVRQRTWPHMLADSMEPVSFKGVEIAAKAGYGGVITLQISNDKGVNFGPAIPKSLGVVGRWVQRIRWLALGTAIHRVFRLRQSDNVPFALYGASVDT